MFGTDSVQNAVDGSDSVEHAERIIRLLFDGCQQHLKQSTSYASEEAKHEGMSDSFPSPTVSVKTDLALQADVHETWTPQEPSEIYVASVEKNEPLHSNIYETASEKTERHGLEDSDFTHVALAEDNMQHESSEVADQAPTPAIFDDTIKKDKVGQNQVMAETEVDINDKGLKKEIVDINDDVSNEAKSVNDRHTKEADCGNDKDSKGELLNVKKVNSKEEPQSVTGANSKEETTVAEKIQRRATTASSRLRQPAIKSVNATDATQKLVHRIERKPVPVTPPKDVKSTSKIAKLSPIIHKEKSVTKKPPTDNTQKKKPTKVSRHLPRVALLASQKPKQELNSNPDGEGKEVRIIKKKISTKEFISRLTAPTVASNNKKLAANQIAVAQKTTPHKKLNVTGKLSKAEFLEQTKILKT